MDIRDPALRYNPSHLLITTRATSAVQAPDCLMRHEAHSGYNASDAGIDVLANSPLVILR